MSFLKRRKYKEMVLSSLKKKRLGLSPLELRFHLRDSLGSGHLKTIEAPTGWSRSGLKFQLTHSKCFTCYSEVDRNRSIRKILSSSQLMPRFHKGKQGSVEHIFNGIVFINDRQQLDHAGFICSKTQSCELIDGSWANGDRNGNPYSSRSAPHNSILCSAISNEFVYSWPAYKLHKDGRGHGTLAGADVKIRLEPFKGCKRRVRNIKGTSVFVELKARMKVLSQLIAIIFWIMSMCPHQSVTDQSITSGLIDINFTAEMMDPALPPNPKKAVLYRPSVPLLTSVVATICEELPPESVVLLYISASGNTVQSTSSHTESSSSSRKSSKNSALSRHENYINTNGDTSQYFENCLCVGPSRSGGFE
ncbi:hypothetical protein P3S68_016583 [Capsicum galapagoense]